MSLFNYLNTLLRKMTKDRYSISDTHQIRNYLTYKDHSQEKNQSIKTGPEMTRNSGINRQEH
jgi:hypothetical protein